MTEKRMLEGIPCDYTAYYCEENIWRLCKRIQQSSSSTLQGFYVIFISNNNETVALWKQRASDKENGLVIWDYHVILIQKTSNTALVFDFDAQLQFPCTFYDYATGVLRSDNKLQARFQRQFRVIPAMQFLQTFASDRSHMKVDDGSTYVKPPPPFPLIFVEGCSMNLREFIKMEATSAPGQILNYDNFLYFFSPH